MSHCKAINQNGSQIAKISSIKLSEELKSYIKLPLVENQLILVEKIKAIVTSIIGNNNMIGVTKEHEETLETLKEQITKCTCEFTKELINDLSSVNDKLDELEFKIENLEESKRKLEMKELTLNEKLRYDSLTKIYNRYEFDVQFEALVESYNNGNKSFTLALLDLDNFKIVNDSYGHCYGDQVLHAIGIFLRTKFNSENLSVFRIGGEEFAILADDTYDKNFVVKKLREMLLHLNNTRILEEREQIDKKKKQFNGNYISHKQTFSAGVQYFDGNQRNELAEKDAFNEVDNGLYKVKKIGRNGVKQVVFKPKLESI